MRGWKTFADVFLALVASCLVFQPVHAGPRPKRCDVAPRAPGKRCEAPATKLPPKDNHPAIEAGGTVPAAESIVPLLKPGTFRLDMSGYFANVNLNSANGGMISFQEALTLGYGVNDRFTVFGGALEANSRHSDGTFTANFVDPKVGFVYRLFAPPQLHGIALDFVGDLAVNEPLKSPGPSFGPYGDIGPIVTAKMLAIKEMGHGLTLQLSAGLLGAGVSTWSSAAFTNLHSIDLDAVIGLAGQYRLSFISDRLYANGELDVMRPIANRASQQIFASPFRTTEGYSATLGASYVIRPGTIVARLTDTVGLNVGDPVSPSLCSRNAISNTVGLTVSFVNLTPGSWVHP